MCLYSLYSKSMTLQQYILLAFQDTFQGLFGQGQTSSSLWKWAKCIISFINLSIKLHSYFSRNKKFRFSCSLLSKSYLEEFYNFGMNPHSFIVKRPQKCRNSITLLECLVSGLLGNPGLYQSHRNHVQFFMIDHFYCSRFLQF